MSQRSNLVTIMRRELSSYFNSPIAYIFVVVFALLIGSLFMSQFFLVSLAEMRIYFHFLPLVLCVFLPAISMRLWSEDKRGNTYELLLTFPMKPHELVLGKFFASFIFYILALAATFSIPIMLHFLGNPDMGPIIGGYFGAALMGALFLAVGIFVSGFFKDQIIAFVISMIACFGLYLIGTEFIASSIDSWFPGFGSFLRTNIGMSRHFASFQKGVIDFRDIVYFVAGTSIFLILNGFWIEGRMRPKQGTIFSSVAGLSILVFLLLNWFLSDVSIGRFDLTEGNIYTISPVSKKILRKLEAPVTVKYYVSPQEKMPTGLKTLEQDVVDKLDEFRVSSKGKFRYKVFHMEAANMVEDAAKAPEDEESLETRLQRKGIQPFQVQSIEADELGVRLIYSALTIAYKEKPEEILPRIIPGNLEELEYLLISKIYQMTLDKKFQVAIYAPQKEISIDPNTRALLEQMGQQVPPSQTVDEYQLIPMALESEGYETNRIELTEGQNVPEGADTLVVLQPEEFTPNQMTQIQNFLAQGGSVFLAAQRYFYEYAPAGRGSIQVIPEVKNPGIDPLLAAYGWRISDGILLDEQQEVLSISGGMQVGPFQVSIPLKLPIHVRIDDSGMNGDISITSRLAPILYLWGSALEMEKEKVNELGLKVTPLLSSSPDSWIIPGQSTPLSPRGLQRTAANENGPFPLAVLLEGQFPAPQTDTSKLQPGKMILTGAVTPYQEQLLQKGGHLNFFLNSIDALTLEEDLMQIRSKQPVNRAIERVSTPAKVWWRFFVTLLVPIIIAIVGGVRIFMRRQEKANYLNLLKTAS